MKEENTTWNKNINFLKENENIFSWSAEISVKELESRHNSCQ